MTGKRILAVLLAAVMLLGCLTGCGKDKESPDPSSQSSSSSNGKPDKSASTAEYAYEAEYYVFPENVNSVNTAELVGSTLYFIGYVKDGEKTETYYETDENGEKTENSYTYDVYRNALMTMNIDTLESQELSGFELPQVPEGWEGNVDITRMRIANDGSIWLLANMYTYRYNVPDDFDPANDEQWNYYESGQDTSFMLHLSADGAELGRVDLGEEVRVTNFLFGSDGTIYAQDYETAYILDKDGNLLFSLNGLDYNNLCKLSEDKIGVMGYRYDEMSRESSHFFRSIDLGTKNWGKEETIPFDTWEVFPGDDLYDFYYLNNGNIFGYKAAEKKQVKVVDWMECDINSNNLNTYRILSDGRVFAIYNDWESENATSQLVILNRVDKSTIQEKTILTLACCYLDWNLRAKIVEYNKASKTHRIVVKDYSEIGDYDAGLQQLNTEIIAGSIPDMFLTSSLPMRRYEAKGLIADLYPLIDADPNLSRDSFVPSVMKALETDGKLYEIPTGFYVSSAMGLDKVVGEYDLWNLAALKDAYSKLPDEEATIFGSWYTKSDVLSNCIARNIAYFVDWKNAKCNFDSDEFRALLEFADSFPAEFNWDDYDYEGSESDRDRLVKGSQLLIDTTISDFDTFVYQCCGFNEPVSFVGYPSESGTSNNCLYTNGGMAISTTCEDPQAAWEFISQFLTDEYQDSGSYNIWSFPINKKAFDKMAASATEYNYATDENGEKMLDENGEPIIYSKGGYGSSESFPADYALYDENGDVIAKVAEWNDTYIEIYKLTDSQVKTIVNLIESCTSVYAYDESIMDIITEECAAFFAGDKDAAATASMIQNRVGLLVAEQA